MPEMAASEIRVIPKLPKLIPNKVLALEFWCQKNAFSGKQIYVSLIMKIPELPQSKII